MKENETLPELPFDDEGPGETQDEPEFEIVDLDAGKAHVSPFYLAQEWFFSKEHRTRRTLMVAVISVFTLTVLLFNLTPIGAYLLNVLPQPGPNTFSLYLDATPGWGELQVDGQQVRLDYRHNQPQFSLSRGEHHLRWLAAPFAAQDCTITLPAGTGLDTCDHPGGGFGLQEDPRSSITFSAQLSQLSTANQESLFQAVQVAIDDLQFNDTIQKGALYAHTVEQTGSDPHSCNYTVTNAAFCFVTASQTLRAQLRLQLDRDFAHANYCVSSDCHGGSEACHSFCDIPFGSGQAPLSNHSSWQTLVLVQPYWRFTRLNGQVIVSSQPNSFILGGKNEHLLPVTIRWNGQRWNVTNDLSVGVTVNNNPSCDAPYEDMTALLFSTTPPDALPQLSPGPNAELSCLITLPQQASLQVNSPAPSMPLATAYVVQRFGVLLAANNIAHRRWPFLPVADADIQHIVQQWIATRNRKSP